MSLVANFKAVIDFQVSNVSGRGRILHHRDECDGRKVEYLCATILMTPKRKYGRRHLPLNGHVSKGRSFERSQFQQLCR